MTCKSNVFAVNAEYVAAVSFEILLLLLVMNTQILNVKDWLDFSALKD